MARWNYPWKERIGPLVGISFAVWLVFRPAYWPFPAFGDVENVEFLKRANQFIWVGVALSAVFVADAVAIGIARHQKVRFEFSSFGPATAGILIAKTLIDFSFAHRPLPVESEQFFYYERWMDVAAIISLPVFYLLARQIGAPSKWSIVLRPPMLLNAPSSGNASSEADAQT